ncbi:MAG: hypothetical protein AMJ62_15625 [Myxococcales bacterium SG8_38]|nr:MAG: hypothetical protein AMJ62_15625 [Myxococcales bacterium SG8_38]
MTAGNAGQSRPRWPSLLGSEGTIDLTGGLARGPLDHPAGSSTDEDARRYATKSRERLEAHCISQIGPLEAVFNRAVPAAKVKWLGLDPQAAALLSRVDGETTLGEVLTLHPTSRLEALRLFIELLDAKAIVRVS